MKPDGRNLEGLNQRRQVVKQNGGLRQAIRSKPETAAPLCCSFL
jgi:hypothetical protein